MENKIESKQSFKSSFIDFTAGSLGGIGCVYVGQPLDTVKVKMQTFPHVYSGMYHCITKTLKTDGLIRGLYAGTTPALIANVAENSVLFAAYGMCQKFVMKLTGVKKETELSTFANASAGFLAAFFSSFTLCPTELVKCQLQAMREVSLHSGQHVHISPAKLTQQIIHNNGIRGLFKGLTSTFMREMPGYFFFFGGYEGTRVLLTKPGQTKDDIGFFKTMVAGAVGGILLWTVIFPADVIKSRIQVSNLNEPFLKLGIKILKQEGPLALYNGLKPTLIRTVPTTAVLFVIYEYSKKYMKVLLGSD